MKLGNGLGLQYYRASGETPVLDDFPGAVAAWSYRLLSSDHSTDTILVERASGSPATEGFTANSNSAIETFCSGVNGAIRTLYDQSGNGNDLIETTFANQPKIHDSSSGLIKVGGKLAFQFNGTSSKLQSANFAAGTACTIFMVAQSTNSTDRYYFDGKGSNNRLAMYSTISNTLHQVFATANGGGISSFNSSSKATAGSMVLFTIVKNGSSSALYENGVQVGAGTLTGDGFTGFTLGSRFNGASFYSSKMQEVIIYNSDQSVNRTAIETAINSYYNIY